MNGLSRLLDLGSMDTGTVHSIARVDVLENAFPRERHGGTPVQTSHQSGPSLLKARHDSEPLFETHQENNHDGDTIAAEYRFHYGRRYRLV